MSVPENTAAQFLARRGEGESLTLLDVREDWELKIASVAGIVHIPMGQVAARLAEIDRDQEVVVLCRSGRRSMDVAQYLQQQGYRVTNLAGGILAWGRDVDPTLASY
jgi:rhodanese-related sulfurtransferase